MAGLRLTANILGYYHDHDGYSVAENVSFTIYISSCTRLNWMNSLMAWELDNLFQELRPRTINGNNGTMIIDDMDPVDVVNILKQYGFVVTYQRTAVDIEEGIPTKFEYTMMKY